MIINKSVQIFDLKHFIALLQKSSQGVGRLQIKYSNSDQRYTTAWLITDDLLLSPHIRLEEGMERPVCTCWFEQANEDENEVQAEILSVKVVMGEAVRYNLGILRLLKSRPGAGLSICFDPVDPSTEIIILQHDNGQTRLGISMGRLNNVDETYLRYDADTSHGAGGAPVLNAMGQVVGMHVLGRNDRDNRFNGGITLAYLMDQLKQWPEWEEIARYHNLVTVNKVKETLEREVGQRDFSLVLLQRAALQWYLNPEELSEMERTILKPYVIDSAKRWAVKMDERRRIINEAGSIEDLRKIRQQIPRDEGHVGERVIDRILEGPPYNIHDIAEEELPFWLQAVKWFELLIPEIPSSAFISHVLEQKRMRSRLHLLAGADFKGRIKELKFIADWYKREKQAPLLVTGLGGIGKSSLISKFLLDQSPNTVFFWLDFDRADLSPDDAESILSVIQDQAYLQIKDFQRYEWNGDDWRVKAQQLGELINRYFENCNPPLLILDGFEVAQYVKKYNEIWEVLGNLLDEMPELKIIVSGRAPVKSLRIANKNPVSLSLEGIDRVSAVSLLKSAGITNAEIVNKVFNISKGMPLALHLAKKFIKEGGDVFSLPQKLPVLMVEGYLYQRILDRIIDPSLQSIARSILVVRKVSVAILSALFVDKMPAGLPVGETFEKLMKEMSLVNEMDPGATLSVMCDNGVLYLRPEVRSATLKLLEIEDHDHVSRIHKKAIKWYKKQDINEPGNRAELIYHYLQVGNINEARKLWTEECSFLLAGAEQDFSENNSKALQWLQQKFGLYSNNIQLNILEHTYWEKEVVGRIRDMAARGRETIMEEILNEKTQRIPDSPLYIYDSLVLLKRNNFLAAEHTLASIKYKDELLEGQRISLLALTAGCQKKWDVRDQYLRELEHLFTFQGMKSMDTGFLLLRSARLLSYMDISGEVALVNRLTNNFNDQHLLEVVKRFIIPSDIVLPVLRDMLNTSNSNTDIFRKSNELPSTREMLLAFRKELWRNRESCLGYSLPQQTEEYDFNRFKAIWKQNIEKIVNETSPQDYQDVEMKQLLIDLMLNGICKWEIATQDLFLTQAMEFVMASQWSENDHAQFAIARAIAGLQGARLNYFSEGMFSLTEAILNNMHSSGNKGDHLLKTLEKYAESFMDFFKESKVIAEVVQDVGMLTYNIISYFSKDLTGARLSINPKLVREISPYIFLAAPDPLEVLCRQLLKLPLSFKFNTVYE